MFAFSKWVIVENGRKSFFFKILVSGFCWKYNFGRYFEEDKWIEEEYPGFENLSRGFVKKPIHAAVPNVQIIVMAKDFNIRPDIEEPEVHF